LVKTPPSLIYLVDLQIRKESITIPHTRNSLGDRSTLLQQGPGEDRSENLGSRKATSVWFCSDVISALVRSLSSIPLCWSTIQRTCPIYTECVIVRN